MGLAAAILAIVLLTLTMPAIERQLDRWSLLPKSEQLTELAFALPDRLPKAYAPGRTQLLVFAVNNHSAKTVAYSYDITEADSQGHQTKLTHDALTVKPYTSTIVGQKIIAQDKGKRAFIAIKLNTGQQIGYWVTRN